jgi:hypothetical protein
VDADALAPHAPVLGRNRYIDKSGVALAKLPHLRRITMGQHRAGRARHDSRKPAALQPEPVMAIGVNTAVKAVELSALNPVPNAPITQSGFGELSQRYDSPLPPSHLAQRG